MACLAEGAQNVHVCENIQKVLNRRASRAAEFLQLGLIENPAARSGNVPQL